MEEKIYGRQVNKESLAHRGLDDKQVQRYTSIREDSLYDASNLWCSHEDRPQLAIPNEDKLLASVIHEHNKEIWSVHKHDVLLQHKSDEELTEEERTHAWAIFEREEELNRLLPKNTQKNILRALFPPPKMDESEKPSATSYD